MRNPQRWGGLSEWHWSDWKWQMENRLVRPEEMLNLYPQFEKGLDTFKCDAPKFRFAVTPFWSELLAIEEFEGPLTKQVIPSLQEFERQGKLSLDPLAEERDTPIPGLVHRYGNRVLLLVTNKCAVYCRFCNRRRLAEGSERDATKGQVAAWSEYLYNHEEVREVILSGGDPLTLTDENLNGLLCALREIPSIQVIRICSRMPVVLPYRVTPKFCEILGKHQPLYLNIHVNHPSELTDELMQSCEKLARAGVSMGSQTVLLRGINDEVAILKELFTRLLSFRIKPYCLYHADPVQGTAHFRTTVAKGRVIMRALLSELSGLAVPHYVLDAPNGRGKVPILPDLIHDVAGEGLCLQSLKGEKIHYPDGQAWI